MHFSKKIKVRHIFTLLKLFIEIVVDLPIIYKSNKNYIYFVHYITSTYYTVVKHGNFDTYDP